MTQKSAESTSWTMIPPNVNNGEPSSSESRALRARFIRSRQMLMDTAVPQRWKPNVLPAKRPSISEGLWRERSKKPGRPKNSQSQKERKSFDDSSEDQPNTLRLATDLPGFNWLEAKIISGDLSTFLPNHSKNTSEATIKSPTASPPSTTVTEHEDLGDPEVDASLPKIVCSGSLLDCYVELCDMQKCFHTQPTYSSSSFTTKPTTVTSKIPTPKQHTQGSSSNIPVQYPEASSSNITKPKPSPQPESESKVASESTGRVPEIGMLSPPLPKLEAVPVPVVENLRPIPQLKPIDALLFRVRSEDLTSPTSSDLEIDIESDSKDKHVDIIQNKPLTSPVSAADLKPSVALLPKKRPYDPSPPRLEPAITPPVALSPTIIHPKKRSKMSCMEENECQIEKVPNLALEPVDLAKPKLLKAPAINNESLAPLASLFLNFIPCPTVSVNSTITRSTPELQIMSSQFTNTVISQPGTQVSSIPSPESTSKIRVKSAELLHHRPEPAKKGTDNLIPQISKASFSSQTHPASSPTYTLAPKSAFPPVCYPALQKRTAPHKMVPMAPASSHSSTSTANPTLLELWSQNHHQLLAHYTKLLWGTSEALNLPNQGNSAPHFNFNHTNSNNSVTMPQGSSSTSINRPSVITNKANQVNTSPTHPHPQTPVSSHASKAVSAKLPPNMTNQPAVYPSKYPWKTIYSANTYGSHYNAPNDSNRCSNTTVISNLVRSSAPNALQLGKSIPEYRNEPGKRCMPPEAGFSPNPGMWNALMKIYPKQHQPMPLQEPVPLRHIPNQRPPYPHNTVRKRSHASCRQPFPPLYHGFESMRSTNSTTMPTPSQRSDKPCDLSYTNFAPHCKTRANEPKSSSWSAFTEHNTVMHTARPDSFPPREYNLQNFPNHAPTGSNSHFPTGYANFGGLPSTSPNAKPTGYMQMQPSAHSRPNSSAHYGPSTSNNAIPNPPLLHGTVSCRICPEAAGFLCAGCRSLAYCSVRCQATHWPVHCSDCKP